MYGFFCYPLKIVEFGFDRSLSPLQISLILLRFILKIFKRCLLKNSLYSMANLYLLHRHKPSQAPTEWPGCSPRFSQSEWLDLESLPALCVLWKLFHLQPCGNCSFYDCYSLFGLGYPHIMHVCSCVSSKTQWNQCRFIKLFFCIIPSFLLLYLGNYMCFSFPNSDVYLLSERPVFSLGSHYICSDTENACR